MNLTRIGANRKELRSTAFENQSPSVTIDSTTGNVSLLVQHADGMGAQGQYDYTITLSPGDIAKVLSEISKEHLPYQAGPLRSAIETSAIPLLRLLVAAADLPFQLTPTASQLFFRKMQEKKVNAKRAQNGDA